MEFLPNNLKEILSVIFEFYEPFGIKFDDAFWSADKKILLLKQSIPNYRLDVADISELVRNLCKILPIFSISDVIAYPDENLGIIMR